MDELETPDGVIIKDVIAISEEIDDIFHKHGCVVPHNAITTFVMSILIGRQQRTESLGVKKDDE